MPLFYLSTEDRITVKCCLVGVLEVFVCLIQIIEQEFENILLCVVGYSQISFLALEDSFVGNITYIESVFEQPVSLQKKCQTLVCIPFVFIHCFVFVCQFRHELIVGQRGVAAETFASEVVILRSFQCFRPADIFAGHLIINEVFAFGRFHKPYNGTRCQKLG